MSHLRGDKSTKNRYVQAHITTKLWKQNPVDWNLEILRQT